MLTSSDIDKDKYFTLNNIRLLSKKELNAIGAENSYIKKIVKVINVLKVSNYIKKIIKDKNIQTIITNNTIDILYLSNIKKERLQIISFIHDILEKKSFQSYILRINEKKINKFIAVSEACKNALINIGIPSEKIEVIYNGIDLNSCKKEIKLKEDNSFIFIGMLEDIKNPLEYISFIEKLSKNQIKYKAKIVYKYYNHDLLLKINELIIEKNLNIELLENIKREEVEELLEKTKYLFICSKKDSLPTVILEAMKNSVFVIAKKVGGIPEMISNKNGILYSDENELEQIILKIKNMDINEYEEKIISSYEVLEKKFNNKNKMKRIDQLLNSIK